MRKTFLALAAALLASPALADTLIDNANGVQVDQASRIQHFTGLLIGDDGKIVKILHIGDKRPKAQTIVDAGGRTLLPGMIDAHGHVMDLGFGALRLNLVGTRSLAELQQRLRAYAATHPDAKWIQGFGWNQELWPGKKFPTAADLDAIIPDRPVVLERVDGHAIVANSAAMRAAGVTAATPAPAGGRIENGLFVDAARELVDKAIPTPTQAEMDEAFAKAQQILLGFGVTGVGSMSTRLEDWNTFRRAGEAGRLQVRLMTYLLGLEPLKTIPHPTGWMYGDRLRAQGVKFFADGALGSRGAWLKQPYSDMPSTRGLQRMDDAKLKNLMSRAAMDGFQVAVHAIGDAANAQVLDAIEELAQTYTGDRRWRIEHAQIVDPADLPRFAKYGTIASMQPSHATSDHLMAVKRLGPERLKGAYAEKTMLDEHVPLAFGSDYPVEDPNPFPGMADAVTREDASGDPPGGFLPNQKISLTQAFAAFTTGAAYAAKAEDRIGSLTPGHYADFILLDRDPFQVDSKSLRDTKVLETWIGGVRAYVRKDPAASSAAGPREIGG
jgi:predicted amidohydrolase YtcJ